MSNKPSNRLAVSRRSGIFAPDMSVLDITIRSRINRKNRAEVFLYILTASILREAEAEKMLLYFLMLLQDVIVLTGTLDSEF